MLTEIQAILEFFYIFVAGIFVGLLGAMTGLGGGTVLVPVLTIFFQIPLIFAIGASLISTIATSAGSASAYTKQKIANVKIGIGLEMSTTAGAIVGTLTLAYFNGHDLLWAIYILFGVVLLFSLIPSVKKTLAELPPPMDGDWTTRFFQLHGSYYDQRLKKTVDYNGIRWWAGEIVMFFAGFISGLLGIGSGALKVLGMDWAMNLPMKVTTTTSNFMIGITAATGSSIYWHLGYIQPFIAAATAIGVLLGAFLGAKLLVKITNSNIRWLFFSILSFLGVEMILEGLNANHSVIIPSIVMVFISIGSSVMVIVLLWFYVRKLRKDVLRRTRSEGK